MRVWFAGLDEMVGDACCWAECCSLSWYKIFAWTSSIVASLTSGLGVGSGSGICCSEPEAYPILTKYCSVKYCSIVRSREFCTAARHVVNRWELRGSYAGVSVGLCSVHYEPEAKACGKDPQSVRSLPFLWHTNSFQKRYITVGSRKYSLKGVFG